MQAYDDFDQLARAALSPFPVNVATFYGRRDTATVSPEARYYVSANGQGLPPAGFTVGRTSAAEAVDAMVRLLKSARREAAQLRENQARARALNAAHAARQAADEAALGPAAYAAQERAEWERQAHEHEAAQ